MAKIQCEAQKAEKGLLLDKDEKHTVLAKPDEFLKRCRQEWSQLDASLAKHSRPFALKEKSLIVHVSHPVYLAELQLQKEELVKRIRALSGGKIESLLLKLKPCP